MQVVYDLVPVIADIISAHCDDRRAREDFMRACLSGHWNEAAIIVEGMLARPGELTGYQERRLRELLNVIRLDQGHLTGSEGDAA